LAIAYSSALIAVIDAGYHDEIVWQEKVSLDDYDAASFVREAAFVVLNSGMRASVVRSRWPAFRAAFGEFADLDAIVADNGTMRSAALTAFNHEPKVDAVFSIAATAAMLGWEMLRDEIRSGGASYLERFPFIGPITSWHLAKSLGLGVAKPDRHLQRIADRLGAPDVHVLCDEIASRVGTTPAVVDLVLWRYATIDANYLAVLAGEGES
jgi:hypothetical protein